MKCSKCNNAIKERQEVCLSCGHILGYESEASKNAFIVIVKYHFHIKNVRSVERNKIKENGL